MEELKDKLTFYLDQHTRRSNNSIRTFIGQRTTIEEGGGAVDATQCARDERTDDSLVKYYFSKVRRVVE